MSDDTTGDDMPSDELVDSYARALARAFSPPTEDHLREQPSEEASPAVRELANPGTISLSKGI